MKEKTARLQAKLLEEFEKGEELKRQIIENFERI